MVSLDIPDQALPDLIAISDVDQRNFDALLQALRETGPTLTRAQLADKIAGRPFLPNKDEIAAIFRAAIAFYRVKDRRELTADGMTEAIANSLLDAKSLPVEKIDILRKRLASLLGLDKSLGVAAKANDVMTEHERIFRSARILSDIRPVFGEEKKQASGAVVIHNLKIGFYQNGKHKELYFALDTQDIEILRTVIERASRKTAALVSILIKSEVPYLEVSE